MIKLDNGEKKRRKKEKQDLGLKCQTPFKSQSFEFCFGWVKQSQSLLLGLRLESNKTINALIQAHTKTNGAFQQSKFWSKIFRLKKFCQQKCLLKIFCPKIFSKVLVKRNFWTKKDYWSKKEFWSKKMLLKKIDPKKIVKKAFWTKKIFCLKKVLNIFLVQKNFCLEKLLIRKKIVSKNF